MYPLRERRQPVFGYRPARRPRLLLESLESRRLLSSTSASATVTPNVTTVTADLGTQPVSSITNPTPASSALTPSKLAAAYSLSLASTSGNGMTIAIVDAYNDPNIVADLAKFSSQYNLPAANLTVQNQYGQTTRLPQTDAGWSLEIALDVEWAHAAAPGAKIILVEANSASVSDLMTAVQTAARQANVVSMSWGSSEFRGETAYDTAAYFANPNVTFIAASGDDGGAAGAEWPAVSPYVLSVGGTTLSLSGSGTTISETAWNASGSRFSGYSGSTGGASVYESAPSYQVSALGSSVTKRQTPDVASDGNPSTGLSVYNSVAVSGQTGWFQVGGTSAGAPVWAGIIAAADQARAAAGKSVLSSTQTLSLLYGIAGSTSYSADLHDITSGSNFTATAKAGYDMVTGLGSPIASKLIAAASTTATTATATKAIAATTTTTTTTHAATHAQVVVAAAPTATTVIASVAVSVPAGAVTTTSTETQSVGSSSAESASAVKSAPESVATTRPVQPSVQPAPVLLSSLDETTIPPPLPAIPTGPGLFVDPVDLRDVGDEALAMASPRLFAVPVWDAALEGVFTEYSEIDPSELTVSPAPVVDLGIDDLGSRNSLALAGLAVAIWGTWEHQRRRSDGPPEARTAGRAVRSPSDTDRSYRGRPRWSGTWPFAG